MTTKNAADQTQPLPLDWHWTQDIAPAQPKSHLRRARDTASLATTTRIPRVG